MSILHKPFLVCTDKIAIAQYSTVEKAQKALLALRATYPHLAAQLQVQPTANISLLASPISQSEVAEGIQLNAEIKELKKELERELEKARKHTQSVGGMQFLVSPEGEILLEDTYGKCFSRMESTNLSGLRIIPVSEAKVFIKDEKLFCIPRLSYLINLLADNRKVLD